MSKSKVSEILKKLMLEKKITGIKFAHDIGVSKQSISEYLRGNVTPKSDILLRMAEYFKVSPEYLLNGIEPQDDNELRLSESAIRLLKQCDDETIGYIDKLLSDAEFYSMLINTIVAIKNQNSATIELFRDNFFAILPESSKKSFLKTLMIFATDSVFSLITYYFQNFLDKNTPLGEMKKNISDISKSLFGKNFITGTK